MVAGARAGDVTNGEGGVRRDHRSGNEFQYSKIDLGRRNCACADHNCAAAVFEPPAHCLPTLTRRTLEQLLLDRARDCVFQLGLRLSTGALSFDIRFKGRVQDERRSPLLTSAPSTSFSSRKAVTRAERSTRPMAWIGH